MKIPFIGEIEFPRESFLELYKHYSEGKLAENAGEILVCIGTIVIWFKGKTELDPDNSSPDAPETPDHPLVRSDEERAAIELLCDAVGVLDDQSQTPVGGILDSIIAEKLQEALMKISAQLIEEIKEDPEKYLALALDSISDIIKAWGK